MQVVAAGITDAEMDALDSGFRLLPVAAELGFAAHGLLRLAQCGFMPLEAVQWRVVRAVRKCGEAGYAHVGTDSTAVGNWLLHLPLGLDAHKPLAAGLADW